MSQTDSRYGEAERNEWLGIDVKVGPIVRHGRRLVRVSDATHEHRDELNTNRADERRQLIRAVSKKFGAQIDQLGFLDGIILQAADAADAEVTTISPDTDLIISECESGDGAPLVPPAVSAAADNFLRSSEMLDELLQDIQHIGIVGEQHLVVGIYLIGTSRLLPQPLSACLQSTSASGKSYIAERVLSLMPRESIVNATDLTANALYYFPCGALHHKVVFAGERKRANGRDPADVANATLALREMISSGKLSKCLPVKGSNGAMTTQLVEQDGPIAYIDSTTQSQLFDEDATRLLSLATDESSQQTARVMEFQAARAAGLTVDDSTREFIVQKHHTAQRRLRGLRVRIPYAMDVALPTNRVAVRRIYPQLLGMIEAVALLRQMHKEEVNGQIDADPIDYWVAYNVMLPILRRSFAPLCERAIAMHSTIRGNVTQLTSHFCRDDCRRWSGLGLTEVRHRLDSLVEAGLIEVVHGRPGVRYLYGLADDCNQRDVPLSGLLTPEQLCVRLSQRTGVPGT